MRMYVPKINRPSTFYGKRNRITKAKLLASRPPSELLVVDLLKQLQIPFSPQHEFRFRNRLRAYQATGSVYGMKCKICRKWSLPGQDTDMVTHGIKRKETYHKKCQNAHAYTIRENRRKKHEPAL